MVAVLERLVAEIAKLASRIEHLSRRDVVGLQAERLRFGDDGLKLPDGGAVRVVARAPRHDHCPVRAVGVHRRGS